MNTAPCTTARSPRSGATRRSLALAVLAAGLAATPAFAADVNVSVSIGDPMYYGRIDFGGPPPPVIYTRPVVIAAMPRAEPPVYLRVPPGHAKNWSRHCARYDACGRRVYFVQDSWYRNVYVPQHREVRHGPSGRAPVVVQGPDRGHDDDRGGPGKGRGNGRGHDKGKHRD